MGGSLNFEIHRSKFPDGRKTGYVLRKFRSDEVPVYSKLIPGGCSCARINRGIPDGNKAAVCIMHTALLFITAGAYWECKCIEKLLLYSLGKRFNRRPRNCAGVTHMSSVRAKITCQRQEILGERLSEKVALPPTHLPFWSLLGAMYTYRCCTHAVDAMQIHARTQQCAKRRFSSSSVT